MKVALCISGLPRFWKGFQKELWDTDYFIHTWNYTSPEIIADTCVYKHRQPNAKGHSIEWSDIRGIKEFFNPKCFMMENYNETTRNYFISLSHKFDMYDGKRRYSVIPMFYGANLAIRGCHLYAAKNGLEYDVIVRCRFDTRLDGKLNLILNDSINIPSGDDFSGLNDQFAYGNMEAMLYYGDTYSYIMETTLEKAKKTLLNPENILKDYLKNVPVTRFDHHIYLERE